MAACLQDNLFCSIINSFKVRFMLVTTIAHYFAHSKLLVYKCSRLKNSKERNRETWKSYLSGIETVKTGPGWFTATEEMSRKCHPTWSGHLWDFSFSLMTKVILFAYLSFFRNGLTFRLQTPLRNSTF